MGRAMIIICAGILISLGIVGMSTADMGLLLTQNTTTYANNVSAKNAAHTGIQMVMQEISDDTLFAENHGPDNKWEITLDENDDDSIYVYVEYLNDDYADNEYWQSDSIRIVSEGVINNKSPIVSRHTSTVSSVYLMAKFSALVPPFGGAFQFPTGYGELNTNGNAHGISGVDPNDNDCKSVPPIAVGSEETKNDLDNKINSGDLNVDGEVDVDTTLDYQPTDELIRRLEDKATYITGNYGGELGSPEDPGVYFVDGEVTLSGGADEGYGIMVIKNSADMDIQDPDDPENTLSIKGNFEFNGLVIFENANAFEGKGTPDVNGSVLVGDTNPDDGQNISIELSGNAGINYSCKGEDYAKMAAANATNQNKYTRVVSFEETGY